MMPAEHMFLLLLINQQNRAITVLLDMLKSRGLLTGDDEQAFQFALMHNAPANAALFDDTKAKYLKLAKSLDLQTGLEHLPQFPEDTFRPS